MPKFKILKQKYTEGEINFPQVFLNKIWTAKIDENDTVDIFNFYAEAKYYADQLKLNYPERNYKVVEIDEGIKLMDVKIVHDDEGNEYKINPL
jgi:hypothetical protein